MARLGEHLSPETKAKLSIARRGVRRSPEAIAKASLANTGKKRSLEICAKFREIQNRPEMKEPRREWMHNRMLGNHYTLGKKWTPKQCAEHKIRMNRPEVKSKISASLKGNKFHLGKRGYRHTPEAKKNIGAKHLGRERPDIVETWARLLCQPDFRKKISAVQAETWKNPIIAKKRMTGSYKALRTTTYPETIVADVLWQDHLLPGKFEYNGQADAGISIGGGIPDFVWNERKLLIEVHGGYYHYRYEGWSRRRAKKLELYREAGFQVLELWDDELGEDCEPEVISAKIHGLINGGR